MDMNRFLPIIAAVFMAGVSGLNASGQNKLDMQGQTLLKQYQTERAERIRTLGIKAVEAEPSPREGAIVVLNDGATARCLREKGFEVQSDLGSVVTVSLPQIGRAHV